MGLFDKMREAGTARELRRQSELAQQRYQSALTNWQASQALGNKMLAALEGLERGQDAVSSNAVMKKGEYAFWTGQASLHESRRQAGTYVGRSSGISIPIGKTGLRYRTGAIKGTFVPGDEVQATLDHGTVLMTTARVIFNGNLKTQEWAFSKWTGADADEYERNYLFHVSNRQKASGVSFPSDALGQEFNRFLGVVLRIERDGIPSLISSLKETLEASVSEKPTPPTEITN